MRRNGCAKPKDASYPVGYGRPPVHTQFKKGVSGNPRGKKKGQKGLKAVVEDVFQQKVSIRTARGIRKVTKLDALVQKLMNSRGPAVIPRSSCRDLANVSPVWARATAACGDLADLLLRMGPRVARIRRQRVWREHQEAVTRR